MNAHRTSRSTTRLNLAAITMLLAALGLMIGFAPSTSAQIVAPDALASQFFDVVGGGGASLYLLGPGAVTHTPEGDFASRTGLVQFGDGLETSFSGLDFSTKSVEQAGSLVIVTFQITGSNTGGYHGQAANCAGISVPGIAVLEVGQPVDSSYWTDGAMALDPEMGPAPRSGLVVEQWIGYDTDLIASQIQDYGQLNFNQWGISPMLECAGQDIPQTAPTYEAPPTCLRTSFC